MSTSTQQIGDISLQALLPFVFLRLPVIPFASITQAIKLN
jgi:hypothetical protein